MIDQPSIILPVLFALALMLAAMIGASVMLLAIAKRQERGWRGKAKQLDERAACAEGALAEIRQKRSQATSKGNRTRADARRAQQRAMTEELRSAIQAKRQPQAEFPFTPGQTGENHG